MTGIGTSGSNKGNPSPRNKEVVQSEAKMGSRNNSTTSLISPSLKPKGATKMKKHKGKTPGLKAVGGEGGNSKFVFSVDDDIDETIEPEIGGIEIGAKEIDREYLEGYSDALKALYLKKSKNMLDQRNSSVVYLQESGKREEEERYDSDIRRLKSLQGPQNTSNKAVNLNLSNLRNIRSAEENLKVLKDLEGNDIEAGNENDNENENEHENEHENEANVVDELHRDDQQEQGRRPNNDDNGSMESSTSLDTIESLNLRERQDAINITHPFGIKLWKPSLYKKNRSVAARADEDIHDYDPHISAYKLSWGVQLCNAIWSLTFGVILYLLCIFGAMIAFVLSGLALDRHLRPYVKLLYRLGHFWLFPFGKFVLLNKDKNYIEEDNLEGRTVSEFQKWRSQEEGRLFFAPPRRNTNTNGSDSRPLMKDHKGRPLRDLYGSIDNLTNSNSSAMLSDEGSDGLDSDSENGQDMETTDIKIRFFGRGTWSCGRFIFYLYFYVILQPIIMAVAGLCWLSVFTIPMSNLSSILCDHLRRHPIALRFESEKDYYDKRNKKDFDKKHKHQLLILCTYRCCGLHYYKYTLDGTNVFLINMLASVIFVILDFYIFKEKLGWDVWFTNSTFIFGVCLISIIPLAYFIGQAVASISAQSSMGVGAVINAFFSTIVEIFLYCVALNQSKGKLVEGSMIGSILGGVLLLPGLSMCGGAIRRKTQRYNPRSAGVSSTMLLFAMVTMFAPSLFYQIYGSYEIQCKKCDIEPDQDEDCTKCRFIQPTFSLDSLYYTIVKPFSMIVALALFLSYVCGLFFTLRTHASLIWATNSHEQTALAKKEEYWRSPSVISLEASHHPKLAKNPSKTGSIRHSVSLASEVGDASDRVPHQKGADVNKHRHASIQKPLFHRSYTAQLMPFAEPHDISKQTNSGRRISEAENDGNGHDAPNWSKSKSSIILLGSTLLYAVIAEILVDNVDSVLSDYPIDPKFLGLTVFALVPNTTEFLNAISFAVGGNVALSMEIGSAYALQVVLIQIPSLVFYSIIKNFEDVSKIFPLVFPRWDIIATLISIYLFTYIYAEGKSNYFKGVILMLNYIVVLIGFWFNDKIEDLNDGYVGGPGNPTPPLQSRFF